MFPHAGPGVGDGVGDGVGLAGFAEVAAAAAGAAGADEPAGTTTAGEANAAGGDAIAAGDGDAVGAAPRAGSAANTVAAAKRTLRSPMGFTRGVSLDNRKTKRANEASCCGARCVCLLLRGSAQRILKTARALTDAVKAPASPKGRRTLRAGPGGRWPRHRARPSPAHGRRPGSACRAKTSRRSYTRRARRS